MPLPSLPWYQKIEQAIAPTETAANIGLAVILLVTAFVLWKGNPVVKATWLVYMVSP